MPCLESLEYRSKDTFRAHGLGVTGTGMFRKINACFYPHELQEVLLQDVQLAEAAVPARGFSVPVAQKTENFFFTSLELHLGQLTS